jgi:superfamily II DNA or RNA helicase
MTLSFGSTFKSEFEKFDGILSASEFLDSIINIVQFACRNIGDTAHPLPKEIKEWRVTLFNAERHQLYEHQIKAIRECVEKIVLSDTTHSGYCFMPTSAGKGHILMTLGGLAVGDFAVHKLVSNTMPDVCDRYPDLFPLLISLGLRYAKLIKVESPRTQILVHDKEILKQLETDCSSLLGDSLKSKIEFHSVQALRNPTRKANLKYVIIDESHWGNASEEETVQSQLIKEVKESGGKAFGFTASPYSDGKFQRTWSNIKLGSDLTFNYYLDKKILYPVTLREVNLQNARAGFIESEEKEEIDLTEKDQVINFMANHISDTLPVQGLDGPAICFFSSVIIPDMVESLFEKRPDLKRHIKVLASDAAFFAEKCKEMFGPEILATDDDIKRLKAGESVFLISRQKLLVGLNAPDLRYCFVSPTNSKIIIMQAIGRLMRPVSFEKVPKKLATLFLTSLSGKKLNIAGKGSESKGDDDQTGSDGEELDLNNHDSPRTKYTTTSMTLSEAYDLPVPVFYKSEVGFRDFINQTRIKDGNAVEVLKRRAIDASDLDAFDPVALREEVSRVRDIVRAQYKKFIMERDSRTEEGRKIWYCQGKKVLGSIGCDRTSKEVNIEIHHRHPYSFADLYRRFGRDGVIAWHSDKENMEHLVSLCEGCHDLAHSREEDDSEGVA